MYNGDYNCEKDFSLRKYTINLEDDSSKKHFPI